MKKVDDKFSPDQKTTVELQFKPTYPSDPLQQGHLRYYENGISYPIGGTFNKYAVKLVLTAADPTVVPMVIDMSAIALPGG